MARQVWRTEPPSPGGRYDWAAVKQRLKTRPGEWTLVYEQIPRSVVTAIRRGNIAELRKDERWTYDCRTRNTNGNRGDLWMVAHRREED